MKFFFAVILTTLSLNIMAAEPSQANVSSMIDEMVKNKMISAEEGEKAKAKMKGMSAEQWSSLKDKAAAEAASQQAQGRMPASISEASSSDIDGVQLQQIQNDIKQISP